MDVSRRSMLSLAASTAAPAQAAPPDLSSRVCLFTDHLAAFSYDEVGRMLKDLGVTGPDLTVRKGGLVQPANVAVDLPRAVETFGKYSLTVPMMTTTVLSAADPLSRTVLETASKLGIRYYRLGYFHYADLARWRETADSTRTALHGLAKLGARLNLHAGMHNHAGDSVGCALWDSWEAMDGVDPNRVGFFFDPSHATIEGGNTGWNLNFRRIAPKLMMVAIKDFVWEKTAQGWRTRWVPLGEGLVKWPAFLALLKATPFAGPISLHIEYDPGGKTKTVQYDRSYEAAARDLQFLKRHLAAA
ncbi:MAG: sugar phosphate isomerase/epimerase [Acidobacteria bacterium]|nr:sugar phosphate isomerase/epimerase [Acidobacteriota bacterium]